MRMPKNGVIRLDPRTKMLSVLVIATIMVSGGSGAVMNVVRILLTAVPLLLFLSARKWKAAGLYMCIYAAAFFGENCIMPLTTGFVNFVLVAFCGIFARMMPGFAMGSYLVSTTRVSEFMAAMERMHVSQKISIPLSVLFRFFPTIGDEYRSIGDAMRMRGIRLGGGKPMKMLEYRMVPLMVSCVKIGDTLSAAALTRGLGAPVHRTNICKIGFGFWDVVLILLCALSLVAFIYYKLA